MKEIINTKEAPQPIGPYNQAVAAGGFLFISGQIAIDALTGNLNTDDITSETHTVLKNLKAILT
ncbi:MAG: RidA family protein, partial [Sphingobacteriaceae bacterium]